jgi:hypothetical protein
MKLPALLLAGSVAANAVLVGVLALKPALAPPAIRDFFGGHGDTESKPATSAAAKPRAGRTASTDRAKYWSTLASPDIKTLVTTLRAAGFSPVLVRAIVNAQLEGHFRERMNALVGTIADTPFWKPEPTSSINNPKFYEELNQIYRERSRLLRELLGDDFLASAGGDATAAQRREYGDIPKSKIDLIQRVVDDYAEMTSQVRAATQGITLPEDREKMALLEREKRADLAAILTPQELEEYEMRNSNITSRMRQAMTLMDASEAEFRTIFHLMQPVSDTINPTLGGMLGPEMSRNRQEAQAKVNEAIKTALGEARYADYMRANNYEYQQLVRIGQRENIASDVLVRTFNLRDDVVRDSGRIYDDKQMSPEEKRAALATVGQSAKAQVLGLLGVKAGNAYIQSANWLTAPERGWVMRMGPDGQANSFYSLPPPTPRN